MKYHISTIQKAIDILNLFENHDKLYFTQIQEFLKLNKSTLFRVLYNLENNRYLSKDEHGRYELGIRILILGNRISQANKIKKVASSYLEELSDKINLTVQMGILDGLDVVIIDKHDPPNTIKMVSHIGAVVPAHCTGQGKTMLAYSSKEKVEKVINTHGLKRYTPHTITTVNDLFDELETIKKRGYAIDDSEHEKHIRCVAVPILDENNELQAALSITGLIMDFPTRKEIEKYAKLLTETRDKIRKKIGYLKS